jgi:prefoldin beta subunit
MDIPKNVQDKLAQFQNIQNQLQMVSMQKQQLSLQRSDLQNAKDELANAEAARVYRLVGPILLETPKDEAEKFIEDESDSASNKVSILEKQEKKLVEKMNEMRSELQGMLGKAGQ